MTNKEKAKEIAEVSQILSDFPHDYHSVEYGAIEMAKWKEQQMIKKASEWLKDMACYYAHWEGNGDTFENEIVFDTEKFIEDFKNVMEE